MRLVAVPHRLFDVIRREGKGETREGRGQVSKTQPAHEEKGRPCRKGEAAQDQEVVARDRADGG